jgi:hypothetical protein
MKPLFHYFEKYNLNAVIFYKSFKPGGHLMSIDYFRNYRINNYTKIIWVILIITVLLGLTTTSSFAIPGLGPAARKGVQEAIEYTAKKFGINLAEESGKHFAREAAEFIGRYGDDGIRALKGAGPEIFQLSRLYGKETVKLCASHSADAAGYLAKNMDRALPVWRQFGKEGTEMMVKHPGLAHPLLDEFGKKGLQIGRGLSTKDLNRFLILASRAAGKKEKGALVDKVLKEGDKIIEFLWKHKFKLAAGATLYTLLKDYDRGFVKSTPAPEGKSVIQNRTHNFIQYLIFVMWDKTLKEYPWLPLIFLALAIWWMWPVLSWLRPLPDKIRDLYVRFKLKFQRRQGDVHGY